MSPRVPEVEMLSTCGRRPGPPQVGPGPPRDYPDPHELSAQLAAREGSGAATCHADTGAGASLPLEARPHVPHVRARAQAFRWKLPHPPALSASG